MVDFDVTDGICCSRAKTDMIRHLLQEGKSNKQNIEKIKTLDCWTVKDTAKNMANDPNIESTFWTELVNNWKRCEGGSF